jgi:hypothetical protein
MVAAVKIIPAGWAEGLWCIFNWSFLGSVIGLVVGGTLLVSIPVQLSRLRGDDHYKIPNPPASPPEALENAKKKADVESNLRRRRCARITGAIAWLSCAAAFVAAGWAYLALDGKTNCGDIHGKFQSALAANLVAALYIFLVIAVISRIVMSAAKRGLPTQKESS